LAVAAAESLGQKVRRLRKQAGMNQQQLAAAAGLAMSMVTHIEQGRTKDPRWSTIQALAKGLGVPEAELRTDEGEG
jgi:transcriptional regulator with XRE-family HTH domain